ncbi:MAG: SDR family NAD(P)-dependent oxidoreductase, partial [Polyangiaceae bacterium]|nr:SDR family NAD(P)-dependent oxidoreductase [Polyangiaceae bacterium]
MTEFPDGAAIVIGASGGIGRAVSIALAGHGADVALTYHANKATADGTAEGIRALGRQASVHRLS